ncbi:metalloregulator ArsR/SmtB family transcription factor [Candidatus Thiothrix sp. Deng01]|uniref:Metalloregulator ArsR/SmtB family transcription factor n=1 Tax=Candidatus Thiothrix phosphatis TaxID=3112415 RepID=A0ABU6D1M5_9GAMM|nr:metalloregulator ArsR/SmtB family transcription factor [Candidatus Thiothrix sp. Deng01]MEB4592583.1 metalloregulator ArsR/SmtB family transcription factor [Candidatus Thiothrix sp. Deng01]
MSDLDYRIRLDGVPVDNDNIEAACRSLKAASHPLRLKIMCLLKNTEMTVQDIVDHVGTTQSNVSQHLAIMRDKGLLSSNKVSNRVYYRLAESHVALLDACSSLK